MKKIVAILVTLMMLGALCATAEEGTETAVNEMNYDLVVDVLEGTEGQFVDFSKDGPPVKMWVPASLRNKELTETEKEHFFIASYVDEKGHKVHVSWIDGATTSMDGFVAFLERYEGVSGIERMTINGMPAVRYDLLAHDSCTISFVFGEGDLAEFTFAPMSDLDFRELSENMAATIQAASAETVTDMDRETVFQVSLLQGLTFGDYNGSITVKALRRHGDTGIGTFDRLNGELIMVDGVVYRAAGDGTVEVVRDEETISFSNVTFFEADETETIGRIEDYDALRQLLNGRVDKLGRNRFYMIRIDGTFKAINVRSEYAQEKPYQPLAQVLEHDQTFFDYQDIPGTIVGLYCPPYMKDLNATGWHLHFVSEDKTKGGHVLGMNIDTATLSWDITDGFQMLLPQSEMFAGFDLTIDQSEDIEKVETKAGE